MSQGMIHLGGLGTVCDDAWNQLHNYDGTWNAAAGRIDPAAWLINIACKAPISTYEYARYGSITDPNKLLMALPANAAPKTPEEAATWNPNSLNAANAAAFEKWKEEARAMIVADEKKGTYDGDDNFKPFLDFLSEYKWFLVAGLVGVVVLARPRL